MIRRAGHGRTRRSGSSCLATTVLALSSAWAAPAIGQGLFFAAPRDFAVGANPQCVASGDFDGDGLPDLAVANRGSHDVAVLLGNGDGTFQAALRVPAGSGPTSVTVGDFDSDGIQDLAVGNYSSNDVSVLLGNGDGTFRAGGQWAVGTGPNFVVTGDFDSNGALDLAVANHSTSPESLVVSVLLGNGDGTFQAARNLESGRAPIWVAVGDFDGGGAADLAVANYLSGDVAVLLGNGDGTFQAARVFTVGAGPGAVEAGDFDGDGAQDLAVANYLSDDVTLLLGNGDGTFQAAPSTFAVGDGPVALGTGDLDGDAMPDLAAANWAQNAGTTVSLLLGNGGGAFLPEQRVTVGRGPASVFVGDLDGDGSPDLAVANFAADTVSVLLNETGGPVSHTLTVGKTGTGSGTVTSSPAGIDCGSQCSSTYASGTVVTLTATPAGGSTFTGWSGGGCSGTGACTVTMTASTSVTASFGASAVTLTVNKTGTGSGTVTSSPAGISCGSTCQASYPSGTTVTLTASASSGSTFAGWSGSGCSGTGACTVTLTANRTVTAAFEDQTPPVLALPGEIVIRATGLLGAIVNFLVTASDNEDPSPDVACAPTSGSFFFVGLRTVTCEATDAAGNQSTGSFLVIVLPL